MEFNRKIVPRRMDFVFDENEIPRWWFGDNPLLTHAANGLHLVFPEGERFFIRSVARYLDRVDDPELKERATAFFQQEASHGREHTHSFEMLERQGGPPPDAAEVDRRAGARDRGYRAPRAAACG